MEFISPFIENVFYISVNCLPCSSLSFLIFHSILFVGTTFGLKFELICFANMVCFLVTNSSMLRALSRSFYSIFYFLVTNSSILQELPTLKIHVFKVQLHLV